MSKITIKHYLNVNLKPYKIDNEDTYNIYVIVSSERVNTKIKSILFSGNYSTKEFDLLDKREFKKESEILENIVQTTKYIAGFFDTNLFTLFTKYLIEISMDSIIMPNHPKIISSGVEYNVKTKDIYYPKVEDNSKKFFFEGENVKFNDSVVFYWFKSSYQKYLLSQIEINKNYDRNLVISNKEEIAINSKVDALNYLNAEICLYSMVYMYKYSGKVSKNRIVLDKFKSKMKGYIFNIYKHTIILELTFGC